MRRTITYTWHLAELMARDGMHNSTDLLPHLRERGIDLSSSQIYRLVTGTPERVSLQFLVACCDIFACTLDDLVTSTVTTKARKAANAEVVDLNRAARPRRARVLPDAD
ncbi:helix-turn-helix transcriptional regulator [Yimella sp. cx-51]|uniref:helix-turn-helix domain-containing protein n=1 Tax=Yimella sp. cx-51 TaxID=2770551 RepID=UPI00165E2527|nr:helix-turn-helix transcriptional regulator [Yimella sp. cx-51]MBC9957307.1 helix-turn-helix transcriptional regulator [Yimella sp. cx-51]QTH36826.1 helix-turn-helix transcriptional regulator [Yimella sp. cx-51]